MRSYLCKVRFHDFGPQGLTLHLCSLLQDLLAMALRLLDLSCYLILTWCDADHFSSHLIVDNWRRPHSRLIGWFDRALLWWCLRIGRFSGALANLWLLHQQWRLCAVLLFGHLLSSLCFLVHLFFVYRIILVEIGLLDFFHDIGVTVCLTSFDVVLSFFLKGTLNPLLCFSLVKHCRVLCLTWSSPDLWFLFASWLVVLVEVVLNFWRPGLKVFAQDIADECGLALHLVLHDVELIVV